MLFLSQRLLDIFTNVLFCAIIDLGDWDEKERRFKNY